MSARAQKQDSKGGDFDAAGIWALGCDWTRHLAGTGSAMWHINLVDLQKHLEPAPLVLEFDIDGSRISMPYVSTRYYIKWHSRLSSAASAATS